MKLSVIIPVYNEVNTLATVLDAVRRVPLEKEIIVVDGNSTDGTREMLFDLARDPGERSDLAVSDTATLQRLRERMGALRAEMATSRAETAKR